MSPSDTARAYADADALALVSRYEPFGALREGVAADLPLIASARAGAVGDIALPDRTMVVSPTTGARPGGRPRPGRDPARRTAMAAASLQIDREWPLQRSVDALALAIALAAGSR